MHRLECAELAAVDERLDLRRRLGRGESLRFSGQAVAAVAARPDTLLAEVRDERVDLAALVRDEREDPLDARRLCLLALLEALGEPVEERIDRVGPREQGVALPRLGRLQLDEPLLLEVTERGDDPLPLFAERRSGGLTLRCASSVASTACALRRNLA